MKGYIDYDDVNGVIKSQFKGDMLKTISEFVSHLEFKNADKVFYSPLFGLPPPFFRYARRFD